VTSRRQRKNAPPPAPPAGLIAVSQNAWLQVWRRIRVDPKAEIKPWSTGESVTITASVKNVGVWASTFADYDDGTRIHPGLEVLANIAGVTPKTAGAALAAMCRLGFLWQYVDGSKGGRPASGRVAEASEYRLTVPGDYLSGRVPLLTAKFRIPDDDDDHPNSDQVNSLLLISDQENSDPVSPELSDQITRTQFAPPNQYLVTDPDMAAAAQLAQDQSQDQDQSRRVDGGAGDKEQPLDTGAGSQSNPNANSEDHRVHVGPETVADDDQEFSPHDSERATAGHHARVRDTAPAVAADPIRCEYEHCHVPLKPVPARSKHHDGCGLAMRRAARAADQASNGGEAA
jgi:hypothetical protein